MARIVLIDDNTLVRETLQSMLQFLGHEVQLAREGQEGRALAEKWPAELVITDVLMDGQEGISTLRDLKSESPDLPVILISGGGTISSDILLKFGMDFGADFTLKKPIKMGALKSATECALHLQQAA